jgi:hypothetical protein
VSAPEAPRAADPAPSPRELAPIAVFAFRRPEHTTRLLASLRANPEAERSAVHVFCDGPRRASDVPGVEATRAAVRSCGLPGLVVVERDQNAGLARSVVEGVTGLCDAHGRVIVLEDDLVLSPRFLEFMNAALHRYADDPRVMHVCGYQYDVDLGSPSDAVFLPFIGSWGWATWARAWRAFDPRAGARGLLLDPAVRRRFDLGGAYRFSGMLDLQLAGRIDSWAIRWYLSVFAAGGLSLFPTVSLVENTGLGGEASHTEAEPTRLSSGRAHDFAVQRFPEVRLDAEALRRIAHFIGWEQTLPARLARRLRRTLRALGQGRGRGQGPA